MNERHLHRKGEDDYDSADAWEGDVLGRQEVAYKLTTLVGGLRGSFVLSLEGSYGEGKTYFLRNWQKSLQEKGYITAYFNSWEHDHSDDPFLPFMACLEQAISEQKGKGIKGNAVSGWKKTGDFAKKIIPVGGKIVIKGLLRHALGNDGLDEINDLVDQKTEDEFGKAISSAVEDSMKKQLEQQKSLQHFRKYLGKSIEELTAKFDDDDQKKIVVLVDELDRCKPTYAVKVLERIKHFFDVDGLVFILGINEQQVANSMAAVYGSKLDTDGYLRRFIHWRFHLPRPSGPNYAKLLVRKFGLDKIPLLQEPKTSNSQGWYNNNFDVLAEHFGVTCEALSLSLREQEQAFTAVNLFLRTLEPNEQPYGAALGVLVPLWVSKFQPSEAGGAYWDNIINSAMNKNGPGPGNPTLNFIDELFNLLYAKIETIGGMQRLPLWSDKAIFEGKFRAWFIAPNKLREIRNLLNTKAGASITENDRRNQCCYDEVAFLRTFIKNSENSDLLQNIPSVAAQIWRRLEENRQLLIPNSS